MPSENTIRVSLRLKNDVHSAIVMVATANGIEPATFMQDTLEQAVIDHLPEERKQELKDTKRLFDLAQEAARELHAAGGFTEHFTLTVIQKMMIAPETRSLYEKLIGSTNVNEATPKKTPLNMYLGWFIKNAINATPVLDAAGKPRRAFVKDEPIKSYTLLRLA